MSFDINQYLGDKLPADITLGEAREYIITIPSIRKLIGLIRQDRSIRIRFLRADGSECPDDMPIGVFRHLEGSTIDVDDRGGGMKVSEDA